MPVANSSNLTTIQILRSYSNTTPTTLEDGQLAYSFVSNTLYIGSNTGIRIIGDPSTAVKSQAAYDQANTATVLAQAGFDQSNTQVFSAGWKANTILVANSQGYVSNSNASFFASNNNIVFSGGACLLYTSDAADD